MHSGLSRMISLLNGILRCAPSICSTFRLDSLLQLAQYLLEHDRIFAYDRVQPIYWPTESKNLHLLDIKMFRFKTLCFLWKELNSPLSDGNRIRALL